MVLGVLVLPLLASPQVPSWSQPYVAEVRGFVSVGESRRKNLSPGEELELEKGSQALLSLEPRDQWGRPFPAELAVFLLAEPDPCPGLLALSQESNTTFRLSAGSERGRCTVRIVAAGNLNLQWLLPVEVTAVAKGGYTRAQAEVIATRLYRALLAREPDPEGFRAAVAEIQRNRLGSLLEGMLKSPEFKEKWRSQTPAAFLEQLYRGLLGRPPDSEGVRRYLRLIERGQLKDVVADIIHSEEFEAAMLRETPRRQP
ncbi:MAG: DUF4214 domain-containing protein [Thermoanaerobaculum sp.]